MGGVKDTCRGNQGQNGWSAAAAAMHSLPLASQLLRAQPRLPCAAATSEATDSGTPGPIVDDSEAESR